MAEFNYSEFVTPQQWRMGSSGDRPIFADCAKCGEKDATIHGAITSAGAIAIVKRQDSAFVNLAVYCGECWAQMTGGIAETGSAPSTVRFPMAA